MDAVAVLVVLLVAVLATVARAAEAREEVDGAEVMAVVQWVAAATLETTEVAAAILAAAETVVGDAAAPVPQR